MCIMLPSTYDRWKARPSRSEVRYQAPRLLPRPLASPRGGYRGRASVPPCLRSLPRAMRSVPSAPGGWSSDATIEPDSSPPERWLDSGAAHLRGGDPHVKRLVAPVQSLRVDPAGRHTAEERLAADPPARTAAAVRPKLAHRVYRGGPSRGSRPVMKHRQDLVEGPVSAGPAHALP